MKKYLPVTVTSFLLFFTLVLSGAVISHSLKFSIAIVLYTVVTYYWLSAAGPDSFMTIGILSLPVLIFYLPLHVRDFGETAVSLPSSLAHVIGICIGYLLFQIEHYVKIAIIAFVIMGSIWTSVSGYDLWINKINFGTYTGRVNEAPPEFLFRTATGNVITRDDLRGKIVVLDFWNTGCKYCFQKFPQLEQYYKRHRNNSAIQFFAVNVPLRHGSPEQAEAIIRKHGYTFPVLNAGPRSTASLFKIKSFPTVVVLDGNQRIVYRGTLDEVETLLRTLR